ncbi:MAG: DUF5592 family protein [Bacillaceae bacterium]
MRTYRIPSEVAAELKINKFLYLFDLLFIISLIVFRMIAIQFVHPDLEWWFTSFLLLFGLFMIIRPTTNPQKRMFHAIYYALIRKKDTYISVDYSEGE